VGGRAAGSATGGRGETEKVVLSFEFWVLSSELSIPCRSQRNQRNQIDQTDRPTRQTSPCAFCEQERHLAAPFHLMLRFPPMCGRFTQTASPEVIAQQFDVAVPPLFTPRYNIAPSQPVAAIRIAPDTTIPAVQICRIQRFDRTRFSCHGEESAGDAEQVSARRADRNSVTPCDRIRRHERSAVSDERTSLLEGFIRSP